MSDLEIVLRKLARLLQAGSENEPSGIEPERDRDLSGAIGEESAAETGRKPVPDSRKPGTAA